MTLMIANITLPSHLDAVKLKELETLELPLLQNCISAGFPSPADNYFAETVNLQQLLISNPDNSYLVKVIGSSMTGDRLYDGDILVVDRSVQAREGKVIIAKVNGEFTVKRLVRLNNRLHLQPANKQFAPLEITEEMEFQAWGVVTWALHKMKLKA